MKYRQTAAGLLAGVVIGIIVGLWFSDPYVLHVQANGMIIKMNRKTGEIWKYQRDANSSFEEWGEKEICK